MHNSLVHWTTTSRQNRTSNLRDVSREDLEILLKLICDLMATERRMDVPSRPEHWIEVVPQTPGRRSATSLTFAVGHRSGPQVLETTVGNGTADSAAWDHAWRKESNPPKCPENFWCADSISNQLIELPFDVVQGTMEWTQSLTQCLAWAAIQMLSASE